MKPKAVKIVVVGKEKIGKTKLVQRIVGGQAEYEERYLATIGADFVVKRMPVNGELLPYQLWDCAGNPRYFGMIHYYFKETNIVFLCYNKTDEKSLDFLEEMIRLVKEKSPECTFVLVSMKEDARAAVKVQEQTIADFMSKHGIAHTIATSAKDAIGINELLELVQKITLTLPAFQEATPQMVNTDKEQLPVQKNVLSKALDLLVFYAKYLVQLFAAGLQKLRNINIRHFFFQEAQQETEMTELHEVTANTPVG